MHDVSDLIEGYQRFRSERYARESDLYHKLGERGQSPKVMVIACCDSRVDPTVIFDASPGQLFVVRNVANLVPPYNPDGDYHGTSAALEFAVKGLEVETILVMGHARCGGVKAFVDGLYQQASEFDFIGKWVELLEGTKEEAVKRVADDSDEARQEAFEHSSIRLSLSNLTTFPFVQARVADGRLGLRGAYFDVSQGRLLGLDAETGDFRPV